MALSPSPIQIGVRLSPEQWRDECESALARIADAKISTIELILGEPPTDADAAVSTVARIQRSAQNHGIAVGGIILPTADSTIGASNNEAREEATLSVNNALQLASSLNIGMVTIAPGIVRANDDGRYVDRYEDAFRHALVQLSELRFTAAERGVGLACRLGHAAFLTSPLDARDFLDRCNSPWIGARLNAPVAHSIGFVEDWLHTLGHRVFVIESERSANEQSESTDEVLQFATRFNDNAMLSLNID